jgi:uncharacterized protein
LRTYVRDRFTGTPGIYCFSLDSSNLLAVAVAHAFYHLPYRLAEMHLEQRSEREFAFYSRRRFSRQAGDLQGALPGTGADAARRRRCRRDARVLLYGALCVFSTNRAGEPIRANLHHVPWPLEEAEAEIERNDLATAVGIELPNREPVLHYSRRLAVYMWPAELVRPALAGGR